MTINIITGIIIVLFLPGFLISYIVFRTLTTLEQVVIGICLSIIMGFIISIMLGLIKLGHDKYGFTGTNCFLSLSVISIIFIVIFVSSMKKK